MDRVHYSGDTVLTGTAIARALLDYAQALAEAGLAATVTIPTIDEAGARGESNVLIGPASQMISDAVDTPLPEVVDEELVAQLKERTDRLRNRWSPTAGVDAKPPQEFDDWSELEL